MSIHWEQPCERCNERYGRHYNSQCPDGGGRFTYTSPTATDSRDDDYYKNCTCRTSCIHQSTN